MSQGYVSGPCPVFIGTGSAGALEFLGWSENGVSIRLVASYRDIVSDFGGPDVPVDSQFMGEHAYISMVLNKYNEAVLNKAARRRFGSAVTPGSIETNGLGALMIAQQYAYQMAFYAPYSSQTFQSASIVPGYLFNTCWLDAEFETPMSVELKRPRCVFHAVPFWNSNTLSAQLYTNTMPAMPALN